MSFTTLRSLYDIPTISFNYREGRLANAPEPRATRSAALNERISLIRQDITTLSLDAIMNAANGRLERGGGIDNAIHTAAGSRLAAKCKKIGSCSTASSVVTAAYKLPARFIIHAVGPQVTANQPPDAEALASCYTSCLRQAERRRCESLGLCCLSTGAYGYPNEEAAEVACSTVRKYLETSKASTLKRVVFVVYGKRDLDIYTRTLPLYFPDATIG